MIPAAFAAMTDQRLHRCDLVIYGFALQDLDIMGFRNMKVAVLATAAHMKKPNVSRSLRRLAAFGYLKRGPLDGNRRTYRLAYSAPVSPVIPTHAA